MKILITGTITLVYVTVASGQVYHPVTVNKDLVTDWKWIAEQSFKQSQLDQQTATANAQMQHEQDMQDQRNALELRRQNIEAAAQQAQFDTQRRSPFPTHYKGENTSIANHDADITFYARAVEVIDGETIKADLANGARVQVRLTLIKVPVGKERNAELVKRVLVDKVLNKPIEIIGPVSDNKDDIWHATVKSNGLDVSLEMVRGGWALFKTNYIAWDDFVAAQKMAMDNKVGLWIEEKR